MAKIEISPLCIGCSCTTLCVKNLLEISLSLTVFEIFTLFHFPQNPRRPPKLAIEIFPLCIGYSCTTVRVKNSLKIALSCMVFEIFTLFHFPLKSKMAAKGGEIEIFPFCIGHSYTTTLWVKKFAQNRCISYGFRNIHTFSFSAKIQDGCQKWRKLKFFPFA